MREIKFRLWCNNKQEWESDSWILNKEGFIFDVQKQQHMRRETHILGQFTGLKDMNGGDIYEGDMLREPDGVLWSVYFDADLGQWYCKSKTDSVSLMEFIDDSEVIGNIHENKELLK